MRLFRAHAGPSCGCRTGEAGTGPASGIYSLEQSWGTFWKEGVGHISFVYLSMNPQFCHLG